MITLAMATEVAAGRGEVWARLVDPEELTRWHPGADTPPRVEGDWPAPGSRLHLLTAVRELPVELRQTVAEMEAGRSLRCRVRLGLYAFEGIWTLTAEGPARTRVGLRIVTQSEVPLVGGALDRFAVRRLAQEMASAWLEALRDRCEGAVRAPATPSAPAPPRASREEEGRRPPREAARRSGPTSSRAKSSSTRARRAPLPCRGGTDEPS